MLTREGCLARRRRFWERLPDACELAIINSPEHLAYLCAYWPSPFTFRTNEAGAALVLTRDHAALVGDNLLRPFMEEAFVDEIIAPVWYEGRRTAEPRRNLLARTAADAAAAHSPSHVAIEHAALPSGTLDILRDRRPGIVCTDAGPSLVALRRTKDQDEVAIIKLTLRQASLAHMLVLSCARAGMTEADVYREVERWCVLDWGEPCMVYGDFAAGTRARGPNTLPTARRLKNGDLLILDFSMILNGYRGDIAHTLCVGDKPTKRQRATFEACVEALHVGEALLRPGTPCREIDAAVRAELARHGFDATRPGHVGHGVGLGHPEAPFLVAESSETLQIGDVVTLEPSLFPADLDGGVRVEHNYLITTDGFERLSKHTLAMELKDASGEP